MSLDDEPRQPSQRERRLERETKRLRYELEVFGRQTPMLRAMIEGAPDALALVSLDGEVFEHNRAFSQLAGADVPCNGRTVAACLGRPTHAPGAPITELLDRAALRASLEAPQTLVGALGEDLVEARQLLLGRAHLEAVVVQSHLGQVDPRVAREGEDDIVKQFLEGEVVIIVRDVLNIHLKQLIGEQFDLFDVLAKFRIIRTLRFADSL